MTAIFLDFLLSSYILSIQNRKKNTCIFLPNCRVFEKFNILLYSLEGKNNPLFGVAKTCELSRNITGLERKLVGTE